MAQVPCGSCRACCIDQTIYIMPDAGDVAANYMVKEVFNPLTRLFGHALEQKPNGECIYLGDAGCTIHDRAPAICKTFDCRRFIKSFGGRTERRRALRQKQLDPAIYAAAMERMDSLDDEGDLT